MFDSKFMNDAWIQCKLKIKSSSKHLHEAANVGILARFYYFHLVPLLLQASLLLVPFLFQVLFLYFCHPYTF